MSQAYTDADKQKFLDHLAKTGVVAEALAAAGIKTRPTIIRWRETDEQFAAAYNDALADAADSLEAEARRRAVEGVVRTKVIGKGEDARVVDELHYSDSLLLALLKAKKPDEFAERTKTELTNPDGTFKPENETAAAARIAAIFEAAKKRRAAGEEDDLFA